MGLSVSLFDVVAVVGRFLKEKTMTNCKAQLEDCVERKDGYSDWRQKKCGPLAS